LEEYTEQMNGEVSKFQCCSCSCSQMGLQYGQTLDVKYCHLRDDIPHEKQLFDSLSVKITKEVVSLNEPDERSNCEQSTCNINKKQSKKKKKKKKKNKGDRYEEIMGAYHEQQQQQQQQQKEQETTNSKGQKTQIMPLEQDAAMLDLDKFEPATHLSPTEWNDHLLSYKNKQSNESIDNFDTNNEHDNQHDNQHDNDGGDGSGAILIDARNIYESKIGYFSSPNVPTLLTNTRKYSTITSVFNEPNVIQSLSGKSVYMYCTGGVRCERASVYLQALVASEVRPAELERPRLIYQLEGGIHKYLEVFGEFEGSTSTLTSLSSSPSWSFNKKSNDTRTSDNGDNGNGNGDGNEDERNNGHCTVKEPIHTTRKEKCLFRGKNFVFDPRRYDPVVGNVDKGAVGQCIICSVPFDDYDNSHAPCENREARCCRCRVLILVCNVCRMKVRVWGENNDAGEEEDVCQVQGSKDRDDDDKGAEVQDNGPKVLPNVYCGPLGKECINEGNDVNHYEIIGNGE